MRKLLVFVALLVLAVVSRASAQEAAGEKPVKISPTYRLDFNLNELEDGKKVNTRSYTMIMQSAPESPGSDGWSARNRMESVTRVPVVTPAMNSNQPPTTVYVDVGLSISARLRPHGETTEVGGNFELGSLAQPLQEVQRNAPVFFRTVGSGFGAEITLGKPMLIASIDDINSTRRYEVEVTATKLK
jgi:hypothetical protein